MLYALLLIAFFLFHVFMRAVAPNAPLKHGAIVGAVLTAVGWACHLVGFEPGPPVSPLSKWMALSVLTLSTVYLAAIVDWSYSDK